MAGRWPGRSRPENPVHSVTTVRVSAAEDRHRREIEYLLMMAFRILCFAGALVTTGAVRWVAVAFAVFLPWIAVLIANNRGSQTHVRTDPGAPALPASRSSEPHEKDEARTPGSPPASDASPSVDLVQDLRHTVADLPSGDVLENDG